MLTINKVIQEAMLSGRWVDAKANGKLLRVKPSLNMTVVFNDGETAKVIKAPNSVGDFLVELLNKERVRKNTCNADISGYFRDKD